MWWYEDLSESLSSSHGRYRTVHHLPVKLFDSLSSSRDRYLTMSSVCDRYLTVSPLPVTIIWQLVTFLWQTYDTWRPFPQQHYGEQPRECLWHQSRLGTVRTIILRTAGGLSRVWTAGGGGVTGQNPPPAVHGFCTRLISPSHVAEQSL